MNPFRFIQRLFPRSVFSTSIARTIYIGLFGLVLMLLSVPFVQRTPEPEPVEPEPTAVADPEERFGVKLKRGDTLVAVLGRAGLDSPAAHAVIEQVRPFVNPRRMRPGHDVQIVRRTEDHTVQSVEFVVDREVVRVKATADGWFAEREEIPFARSKRVVRGTIRGSLYQSGTAAGLTSNQIMSLARIFEYDIDFFSDLQRGDAFSILFEEIHYADGRRQRGRILAAELEARGEPYNAFYFVSEDGGSYYDADGRAVRRSFLRAPLSYARISSPFSTNRRHPIFRTLRPHRAIDYAAPQGTPVVAIGRGRVEFVGWRTGYGNTVEIRHSGGYVTLYAHFSRFARGIRRGKSVEQGEVIGYVGQTGHATGPHLHFEFIRHGQKLNFLEHRIEKIDRLGDDDLRQFELVKEQQQAMLRNAEIEYAEADATGLSGPEIRDQEPKVRSNKGGV